MGKMKYVNTTILLVGNQVESAYLNNREWGRRKVLKLVLGKQYIRRRLSRKVISAVLKS
jgi:hypothetical protein